MFLIHELIVMTLNSVDTLEFDFELINCINFNIPWGLDHMSERCHDGQRDADVNVKQTLIHARAFSF